MFYADFVLSKKGPLARIWLAAHWDKKLTKAQIFETNIESSIERILKPKVKLALRTSGHLMLGVVRIYSRKTKYLLADCNEAFVKIKMAFRPGMVDLPEDHREAAVNAVTLPEVFHDFDSAMPDLNDVDIEAQFTLNQSRADEITMREDNVSVLNPIEEYGVSFDNKGFDNAVSHVSEDVFREGPLGASAQDNLFFDNFGAVGNKDRQSNVNMSALENHVSNSNFDGVGLFEDFPGIPGSDNLSVQIGDSIHNDAIPSTSKGLLSDTPRLDMGLGGLNEDDDDDFGNDFIPTSPGGGSSDGSRPASPTHAGNMGEGNTVPPTTATDQFLPPTDLNEQPNAAQNNLITDAEHPGEGAEVNENQNAEQTTLLQNEEESFALAPVDASALKGLPKTKRKRKLIVDEVKNISGEEMKAQLSDTSDIVITLDLAPPTKRLMHWKETGGVEKLFALPGRCIPSTSLFKNYQRHLTSRVAPNDEGIEDRDAEGFRDGEALELGAPQAAPAPSRRGRKRKQIVEEEDHPAESATQETQKKTRMSPQTGEETRLPAIPEEPFINDPSSTDKDGATAAPLSENIEDVLPQTSVPPVTMDEHNPLPSYPDQSLTERLPQSDQQQTNADSLFGFGDGATDSLFQGNQDFSKDNMMENMGYDGQDQEVPHPDQNQGLFTFNEDLEHNPVTPGLNAGGGITPWHDADYDNPVSVGPMEERGDNETLEQFEERILNKRAGHLYDTIKMRISTENVTAFTDIIMGNSRKQVAQKFYSLLVLKKHKILELTQEIPYGNINLTKGSAFDAPKL